MKVFNNSVLTLQPTQKITHTSTPVHAAAAALRFQTTLLNIHASNIVANQPHRQYTHNFWLIFRNGSRQLHWYDERSAKFTEIQNIQIQQSTLKESSIHSLTPPVLFLHRGTPPVGGAFFFRCIYRGSGGKLTCILL